MKGSNVSVAAHA
jgi:hypothetical protein